MLKQSILQELLIQFDGKRQIKAVLAAKSLGWSEGTGRNKIANGTFPLPVTTVKSARSKDKKHVRHFVQIRDLANYLTRVEVEAAIPACKRKVGRPTKASKLFRNHQDCDRPSHKGR